MTVPPAAAPASQFYLAQGLRLHYADWGNADAPTLILQHGGRDHARNWDWVAGALRRDYHVIAPDLRGHGDSQWSPDGSYSLAAHIYDLAQLIHQLGPKPVILIGHSLGAVIALRYAGLYPQTVSKLIAVEGFAPLAREIEDAKRPADQRLRDFIERTRALAGRLPRRYASEAECVQRMREENPRLPEPVVRHLAHHAVKRNEDGSFSWKFDNYARARWPGELSNEEVYALWSQIACPTLLLFGAESRGCPADDDPRFRHLRNARTSRIAGGGHWLHHEKLDPFMFEVTAFLRG